MGIQLELITLVVIVFALFYVTGVKAKSSGGFGANIVENIAKSRHKIVHTIQVKSPHQSQVSLSVLND